MELVVSTVVAVLTAQRNLLEYLPQLGHIPRVVAQLQSKSLPVARSSTLATHQFTYNQVLQEHRHTLTKLMWYPNMLLVLANAIFY